jgi:hypothetical protein
MITFGDGKRTKRAHVGVEETSKQHDERPLQGRGGFAFRFPGLRPGLVESGLSGRKPRNDEVRCPAPKEPFDQFLFKRADSHERANIRGVVQNAPILMKGKASEAWCETRRFS